MDEENENILRAPGILDFISTISTEEKCIDYLREMGILPSRKSCNNCQLDMTKIKRGDSNDGEMFRCPHCSGKQTIRSGTLFEVCT